MSLEPIAPTANGRVDERSRLISPLAVSGKRVWTTDEVNVKRERLTQIVLVIVPNSRDFEPTTS